MLIILILFCFIQTGISSSNYASDCNLKKQVEFKMNGLVLFGFILCQTAGYLWIIIYNKVCKLSFLVNYFGMLYVYLKKFISITVSRTLCLSERLQLHPIQNPFYVSLISPLTMRKLIVRAELRLWVLWRGKLETQRDSSQIAKRSCVGWKRALEEKNAYK